ncbi:MAG: hypothetical protein Q8Q33_09040, partial [Chlamydiota bacterium]|nr:hypothetical protein [Chlamydiota bacterium]
MFNISLIDLLIVLFYFICVSLIGLWWARREHSLNDYFLGSNTVPWWAASLSVMATECSALTFIGAPGIAFKSNMMYLQLAIGSFIGRVLSAKLFLSIFYDLKLTSIYEYLQWRFGTMSKNAGSLLFFITRILASGVRLYAASIAVSIATGFPMKAAIIIVALFVMVYTISGGIRSVIWTDVFQIGVFMG